MPVNVAVRPGKVLHSADPDDVSAQIDLFGVPLLMVGGEPSAAPNGGYFAVQAPRPLQNGSMGSGRLPSLRRILLSPASAAGHWLVPCRA
jgi:hypothetical protein